MGFKERLTKEWLFWDGAYHQRQWLGLDPDKR